MKCPGQFEYGLHILYSLNDQFGQAMKDYCHVHSSEYHQQVFHIDPTSFFSPLANRLNPGATILDIGYGSGSKDGRETI